MPAWLVLAIIVFVIALLALLLRRNERARAGAPLGWIAGGLFVLAALFVLVSSYNPVGTKEEGIETAFGKTVGHLSNGPHLTAPWVKVHEMDAAIQTDSYVGKNGCIDIRIANQQTGCASVSFQWRIQPGQSEELYKDYRSFDHVRDALVTRKLTAAVNEAFSTFNPLDSIVAGEPVPGATAPKKHAVTLHELAGRVSTIMRREVGQRIEVLSTIIPLVTFDDATQGRINQLQQQVALTRIATQELSTNRKKATANAALQNNVPTNVLVSRCLDTLEEMVKARQAVPAGFSCWPGNGVAAVIAGGGSK